MVRFLDTFVLLEQNECIDKVPRKALGQKAMLLLECIVDMPFHSALLLFNRHTLSINALFSTAVRDWYFSYSSEGRNHEGVREFVLLWNKLCVGSNDGRGSGCLELDFLVR